MAVGECRYNPISYHNGTVWPHDNALIALGLARYGLRKPALRIAGGMFDAMRHMDLLRPPELFCGFTRRKGRAPTQYPVACSPQAWASAMPFAILDACLGTTFDTQRNEIRFLHPVLPDFMDELMMKDVVLNKAKVDILLRRCEGGVLAEVTLGGSIPVVVVK
jgi:glycogen debranching enzyme